MSDNVSEIEKSLRSMYELGREHGYDQAVREMDIKRLQEKALDLANKDTTKPIVHSSRVCEVENE